MFLKRCLEGEPGIHFLGRTMPSESCHAPSSPPPRRALPRPTEPSYVRILETTGSIIISGSRCRTTGTFGFLANIELEFAPCEENDSLLSLATNNLESFPCNDETRSFVSGATKSLRQRAGTTMEVFLCYLAPTGSGSLQGRSKVDTLHNLMRLPP